MTLYREKTDTKGTGPLTLRPCTPGYPAISMEKDMSNIDKMVDRFLAWKLPGDFGPDAGVTFNPGHITPSSPHWPTGTNLLTAAQARQMFEHVTADEPAEGLQPHQQRVITEKADLDEKLVKLIAFFQTPVFADLSEAERSRMRNQARFMDGYSAVLGERIAAFTS